MHTLPHLRVWLRFDFTRREARTGFALLVRALGALGPIGRVRRVFRLAFVAFVVGDGLGPKLVAGVTVGITVFLGSGGDS